MIECFEDRVNHRSEWFDLITNYNKEDRTRLTKEILKISVKDFELLEKSN